MKLWCKKRFCSIKLRAIILTASIFYGAISSVAQTADGNNGLSQANTMIRSYYDNLTLVMYAIGGVMAFIGAVNVYSKMNNPDGHVGRAIAIWFGGCIFLVLVSTVIRSFFGL